jgi:hypothetical protein
MLKKLSFCLAAFVIVTTGLFVMNQTAQAVSLANALHPLAGHLTLIALLLFYAAVIAVPVGIWMRIPKALTPPEDGEASPEFPKYVEAIPARLRQRRH